MGREKGTVPKIKITIEDTDATGKTKPHEEEVTIRTPLRNGIKATRATISDDEDRTIFLLKVIATTSTFFCVTLLVAAVLLCVHLGSLQYCFPGNNVFPRDLEHPGVFDDMTQNEYHAVLTYMFQSSGIDLTPFDLATVNSSYIYLIDLHIPLKPAVLEYLDRGSLRLERAAKVVVVRGNLATPRVEEYLVSPLPNPRTHKLARNPAYARYPIPYTSRPVDKVDYKELYKMIKDFTASIYGILMESYGLCYHNCTKGVNCMTFHDVAPRGRESGERKTWFWAFRDVEGYYLHPLGLEVQINHESNDVSEWKIERVVYYGQLVYTIRDLVERYKQGSLRKLKLDRPVGNLRDLYSSYHQRRPSEMPIPLQGARLTEPQGHRFTLTGQHVRYMHWDLNVRMRPSTGLQIFDVRFQSERVAYEISLQEGVVLTTGYGPAQTISNLYLSSWLLGASSFELVRGVDCPDTASYLDSIHLVDSGAPKIHRNSICIFEMNPGVPLRRHYSNNYANGYTKYGGIIDYQLIVRHIATIWNSDYIFDYIFRLNGEIEIRVSTTGYLQTTFNLPFEKPYGNTVYYDVHANVFQCLFHFKMDLDIGNTENRFSVVDVDLETIRHPWYSNINKTQFVLRETKFGREMDYVIDEESGDNRYHIIYNEFPSNKYKTKRAYRILNQSKSKFLLDEVSVTNAAKWARYPLVVTKYDDTEDQSSSIYAQNDPWDPVVDFERFVADNDTIVNEDLVAWATLGMYHIPHSEDVPSLSTSASKLSVHLIPYNFFTECPSVSSPSTVQITPSPDYTEIHVNTFGTTYESTCVPPTYGPQVYYGYRGDDYQ